MTKMGNKKRSIHPIHSFHPYDWRTEYTGIPKYTNVFRFIIALLVAILLFNS